MMKVKKFFIAALAGFLVFYLSLFITLVAGQQIRDYFFREFAYQAVTKRIIGKAESDSAKAVLLYNYVSRNISAPMAGEVITDENPFETLVKGAGSCDQQSNLLITLAGVGGIKGRLVFLYGNDNISHHSVCELELENKYRMFDPFYTQVLLTSENKLAGIDDIQEQNILPGMERNELPLDYFSIFEKENPYRVFLTNELPLTKNFARKAVGAWYFLFDGFLLRAYTKAYLFTDKAGDGREKRIRKLLFSTSPAFL